MTPSAGQTGTAEPDQRAGTAETTIVVPTVGRDSLRDLLTALATSVDGPFPWPVVVVDDRPTPAPPLAATVASAEGLDVTVLRSGGGGPARARNVGWRHARTPWVSFLDDDVLPTPTWAEQLAKDLASVGEGVAGIEGRVIVPLPDHRRPTDWERMTAGLETARWITADLTYRRSALARVGGFDERFRRAFREDADLGLRVTQAGGAIVAGSREVLHPPRPAGFWASLGQQRGNADDRLMRALHGPDWRRLAGAPRGRLPRHVLVAAAGVLGVTALAARRRRVAGLAGGVWLAGTAEFAAARIVPGPRTPGEIARMAATSVAIPVAATWHSLRGAWRHWKAGPWRGTPELVLFDRDGTVVHDVPYNRDPAAVRPVDRAREALDRLREAGVRVGMVTNQSGVASGLVTEDELAAVQQRVTELLGPWDVVEVCPHGRDAGCHCRKPEPGMVLAACERLEVEPARCVVVGDIETDLGAARAAGAAGILVPTPQTRREEVDRAGPAVAPHLSAAVDRLLAGEW
jgi:HAD superfamily hydrolase (TIGR01662 family)